MALALPVFKIERLAGVMPMVSASSAEVILFLANATSKLITIIPEPTLYGQVVFVLQGYRGLHYIFNHAQN